MKIIFPLAVAAIFFAMMLLSCKKTVTDTITIRDTTVIRDTVMMSEIAGFWPGLYESPGQNPDLQFSFLYRSDGTLRVYGDGTDTTSANVGEVGDGTYSISGSVLTTHFTFIIGGIPYAYSSVATISTGHTFYEGTVGQDTATSGAFVFIGNKQ